MTLKEFIRESYPIHEKVQRKVTDPVKAVLENDNLPYDDVRVVDGILQKVVYIDDDEVIPVIELLGYSENDIASFSHEFQQVYKAYMDNVIVEDFDIKNIIGISKQYVANKKKKKEMLS